MKFRACEELLFEQAICSTSHLRKINEQSNCLWDTTTQYSHLLGQFCDSFAASQNNDFYEPASSKTRTSKENCKITHQKRNLI